MIYTIFYLARSRGCGYFFKKYKIFSEKELAIYKKGQYCYYISYILMGLVRIQKMLYK